MGENVPYFSVPDCIGHRFTSSWTNGVNTAPMGADLPAKTPPLQSSTEPSCQQEAEL